MAEAAMRASLAAGPSDAGVASREAARATGSLMTPGEVAEIMGAETVELAVLTYRFYPGGRIEAPVDMVVRCEPPALEGVRRSMAKLMESRQWSSELRVGRELASRSEVMRGSSQGGERS